MVGRWYDRKTKNVEEYLADVIVALAPAAALVKHRRAEAEEQARIRAEEAERRQREQARRERAVKRRDFLSKKADAYMQYRKLVTLAEFLASKANPDGKDPLNRIVRALAALIETEGHQFEADEMNAEVERLQLFTDDDSL